MRQQRHTVSWPCATIDVAVMFCPILSYLDSFSLVYPTARIVGPVNEAGAFENLFSPTKSFERPFPCIRVDKRILLVTARAAVRGFGGHALKSILEDGV